MRPLAVLVLVCSSVGQSAEKANPLKILLVVGQGAINVVNRPTERHFTIRVEEKYGIPGKHIPVTFTLPNSGPGGYFKKKKRSVTVHTDQGGYAMARGYRPNRLCGQYRIEVTAFTPDGPVTAWIPQTNARETAQHGGTFGKLGYSVAAAVGWHPSLGR